MTKTKQLNEELSKRIDDINAYYLDYYMETRRKMLAYGFALDEVEKLQNVFTKANDFDIFKAKCGKGGKQASENLSKKQRIDRARLANTVKARKAQKEKERKHQRQIDKHRI